MSRPLPLEPVPQIKLQYRRVVEIAFGIPDIGCVLETLVCVSQGATMYCPRNTLIRCRTWRLSFQVNINGLGSVLEVAHQRGLERVIIPSSILA